MKGIKIAGVGLLIGLCCSPSVFAKTYYYFYTNSSGKQVTVVRHNPTNAYYQQRSYQPRNYYASQRYQRYPRYNRHRSSQVEQPENNDVDSNESGGLGGNVENYSDIRTYGGHRKFVFSPRAHKWYAYENGRLVNSGRASGGKGYCPDIHRSCRTPQGVFRVSHKGPSNCRSTRYPIGKGGARMDYCMFFSKYYAVHGSNDVPGYNASHGCIRVVPSAARWLNQNFLRAGDTVVVTSY